MNIEAVLIIVGVIGALMSGVIIHFVATRTVPVDTVDKLLERLSEGVELTPTKADDALLELARQLLEAVKANQIAETEGENTEGAN